MRKMYGLLALLGAMLALALTAPGAAFAGSLDYELVGGTDQTIGTGEDLVVTAGGTYDELDHVEIDSVVLESSTYTCDEGTMVVTIDADYLAELGTGEHDLTLVYEDGTGSTTFTIAEAAAEDGSTSGHEATEDDEAASDDETTLEEDAETDDEDEAAEEGSSTLDTVTIIEMIACVIGIVVIIICVYGGKRRKKA